MKNDTRSVGRPSLGVTKKVSITLPDSLWSELDKEVLQSQSSRSALFRDLVIKFLCNKVTK